VSSGEKPRLQIPDEYKVLVRSLEGTKKPRFSEVTTSLLDFDVTTMETILENIEQGRNASLHDGNDHDLTLEFGDSNLGLTIFVSSNPDPASIKRGIGYCLMRKYQLKFPRWILLIVNATHEGVGYDFRFFDAPWAYNVEKEQELAIYRQKKMDKHFASFGKPGRNDPCPCNSTLKYKKCCGKQG
jgi:hypothetical protein